MTPSTNKRECCEECESEPWCLIDFDCPCHTEPSVEMIPLHCRYCGKEISVCKCELVYKTKDTNKRMGGWEETAKEFDEMFVNRNGNFNTKSSMEAIKSFIKEKIDLAREDERAKCWHETMIESGVAYKTGKSEGFKEGVEKAKKVVTEHLLYDDGGPDWEDPKSLKLVIPARIEEALRDLLAQDIGKESP